MKRVNIFTLALTLALGCWVGSASARLLTADDAVLVPYYEVRGNLATIIGVQNRHTGPIGVNVTVHAGDDGTVVENGRADLCLDKDEFGFVVLQSSSAPADTDQGVYFSVAQDGIDSVGFVTLAHGGTTERCAQGTGTTAGSAATTMVAWATLQDVGEGSFFATEIPVVDVKWQGTTALVAEVPAKEAADAAYCYLNTDTDRTAVTDQVNTVLNSNANLRCDDAATYTYVPANRALPAIPAVPAIAPGVQVACTATADCPGLAFSAASPRPWVGARFDVASFNRSVSNIYLWLSTAPGPVDPREGDTLGPLAQLPLLSVICEDGMETDADIDDIDITGHVNVINPSRLGCSGRGVLNLKLPRRAATEDYCYDRDDDDMTAVRDATILDDRNNRCFRFTRKRNSTQTDDTHTDAYFCYNSTTTSSSDAVIDNRVADAEVRNPTSSTPNRVTGCKSYTYVPDVRADNPNGFMFSHISQADAHYRMNFSGYTFTE